MKHSILAVALLSTTACGVSQQKYDAAAKDASSAHAATKSCEADNQKLRAAATSDHATLAERDQTIATAQRDAQYLQTRLDGATAETQELRRELERLGKNAEALLSTKGALSGELADAKARLEELRRAQAAADARAALFKNLAERLHKMVDAGALAVTLRDGRMVLQLPTDILFDSGQTVIKPEGKETLSQVGAILGGFFPTRRFQVAGNTDDVPIQTARFPSNWELSTGRAVEVVRFLVAHGMKPENLAAAGYGEFDPVAPNATPEGKAKNRRIEIALQPDIDELVAVPAK
ncbi:MAG TPA: OmpA family protein [Polyangiaceae bacterium]|nr:OmpA family protein [Polyangiaceae bacterium]